MKNKVIASIAAGLFLMNTMALPSMADNVAMSDFVINGTGDKYFNDISGDEYYANAAEALAAMSILKGDSNNNFAAERTITRAEMATVICRMTGREEAAKSAAGTSVFNDVPENHWASGYIKAAYDDGVISGNGAGAFMPEGDIKYEEAIKMVVSALGLEKMSTDPDDWAAGYIETAKENGITINLKGDKGTALTRGDVAVMVYNALSLNASKLVINEVCVSNKTGLKSGDGSFPDWIEIYNGYETDIPLDGYGLSDGTKNPMKFTFPVGTVIKAGEYLTVLCDGDGKVKAAPGEYLAPFDISAKKRETVYLTHPRNGRLDALTIPSGIQTDTSYGRTTDGGAQSAFLSPTPGESNNNAKKLSYAVDPVFSTEGGFYNNDFTLELSGGNGQIFYTLDGSDPISSKTAMAYSGGISIYNNTNDPNVWSNYTDISIDKEYEKPDYSIDKGIVVRAAAKGADGEFGRVVSNTYFIGKTADYYKNLKVISLTTDGDNLFGDDKGIYVVGSQYRDWVNSPEYDPSLGKDSPHNPTNYNGSGSEWEIPADIQVFENGKAEYSAGVGVRINGNYTRAKFQKSLRIYARSESKLEYAFIPGLEDVDGGEIASFDKLILRNGGNDNNHLFIRDAIIQDLCKDRAAGIQGYEPCILFINGEFWGLYNIRERVDENYFKSHYHVDKKNLTILKNSDISGLEELSKEFRKFCEWGASADMTNADNYAKVLDTIDVEGLMDMIAVETYVNNNDFAANGLHNYQIWRTNTVDKSNPYSDGKWRFMLNDLDMSSNIYSAEETSPQYDLLNNMNAEESSFFSLFYNLLNNEDFRTEFYARYVEIATNNLSAERVSEKADEYAALCKDAISDTYKRFHKWRNYDEEMQKFKDFFNERPEYALKYLDELVAKYEKAGTNN